MYVITNLLLFKLVWALSLAGVVLGYAWLGLTALLAFSAWHAYASPSVKADFFVVGVAVLIGLVLDTLYVQNGLIEYNGQLLWSGAAPLWILALWANFALTMNGCLTWLRERKLLAAGLALVCGPLSYYGGIALGTATITGDSSILFASIGLAWAIAVPFLLWLSGTMENHFDETRLAVISPS
jgi:hypothetical protein